MKGKVVVWPAMVTIAAFILAYVLHTMAIGNGFHPKKDILFSVYGFHLVFSLVVVIAFQFLSTLQKAKDQLGFIYLAVMAAKLGLFMVLFSSYFFGEDATSTVSHGNFLVPVFLGLACEVTFLARTLKNME
ncbi:DUF6168 family protein [Flagellimonas baculiformis]|uniref:DUF6168 family protein n=1 Tax=Flagellimonas baculiformis TaxID=3067310 RepID=UPI00296FEB15|nr:DUF6168 family protein [Muricauda sp. D6]